MLRSFSTRRLHRPPMRCLGSLPDAHPPVSAHPPRSEQGRAGVNIVQWGITRVRAATLKWGTCWNLLEPAGTAGIRKEGGGVPTPR
eukprot:5466927-Alexandrium_andersonii.AAC.1